MTTQSTPLDDSDFLKAFLDVVIPPGTDGKMPGAGTLGLGPHVADALRADASLGPAVQLGLEAVRDAALARAEGGLPALSPEARLEVVKGVADAQPWLMMAVVRYLYPAYYQHPGVLEALGEPPRPPFPEGFEVEPTDPRLLERLEARRRG
jgi:hypothetical protein